MDKFVNEVNVQKENYALEDRFSCKKIKYKDQTLSPNKEQVIDLTSFIFGVHSVKVNGRTYYPNNLGEVDVGEVATLSDIQLVNEKIDSVNTQLLQKLVEEQNERIQSDKKINVSQSSIEGYITFTNSDGVSVDIWVGSSGSGDGTDYNNLANKPSINGIQLIGDKNGHDLNLANLSDLNDKQDKLESGITIKTINNQSLLEFGNLELQNKLESGVTIKTINNQSILGSGNITIQGGSGGTSNYNDLSNKPSINNVELNGNKSLSDLDIPSKSDVNAKQDKLQSGINIKTINHQSIIGSGNINIEGGGGGGDVGYVQTVNGIGVDGNANVTLKTSDIENDSNYITEQDISEKVDKSYVDETFATKEKLNQEITNRENGDNTLREELTSLNQLLNTIQSRINELNTLIPNEASQNNKLADKNFVNSSISTNTSNFIGTFNTLEELEQQSATNNDYAFWKTTDSVGVTVFKRYKYVSEDGTWQFEYDLNNSSFTAEQWNTINSGLNQNSFKTINEQSILGEGDITIESDKGVELTQEEYDNLSEEEKTNGTVYYCKDGLPKDIKVIDDSVITDGTTWSSEKIDGELTSVRNSIPITWSESHIKTNEVFFDGKPIYRTCKHFAKNGLVIYDNKWVTKMTTGGNIDYLVRLFVAIKTDISSTYGITDFYAFGSVNPTSRLLVKNNTISLAYTGSTSDHSYTFPYECVLVAEYTVR